MKYSTAIKISFIFLILTGCSSAFARTLESIEFQLKLDINWTNSPDLGAIELGTHNPTDSWTMRVKFVDVPIVEQNCGEPICTATIHTSQFENNHFSIMIDSTISPDENHPSVFFDALRSYDTFRFSSDTGNNEESFTFKDRANGIYEPGFGTGLHTWILDRSLSSPLLNTGAITRTSEGFVDFLSSHAGGFMVEEFFVNHVHQISYKKTGVAVITDIQQVTGDSNPIPAECHYEVTQEWNEGFTAKVRINNRSLNPIEGWRIKLEFDDFIQIDNFWDASVTGIPPFYVADSQTWNGQIPAGQEVSFGFIALKAADQSSVGTLESIICR